MPFTRIRQLVRSFEEPQELSGEDRQEANRLKEFFRTGISFAAFIFAALLIALDTDNEAKNFGYGLLGTVVGYRLR